MNKIAIIIIATNSYFILGLRFIKKFMHYYNGNSIIKFYFFSDHDPRNYFSSDINLEYIYTKHNNWLDATNSKFYNIKSLENKDEDYFYYFDAATNAMATTGTLPKVLVFRSKISGSKSKATKPSNNPAERPRTKCNRSRDRIARNPPRNVAPDVTAARRSAVFMGRR